MTSNKPIGVGIIGLSATAGWAAAAHVPALEALDGFELRALSASTPESAKAAGERYDVPLAFSSAEELAQHPDVDLVVVAVKTPKHDELIRPALEAGKMVLCEWPLSASLPRAEDLAKMAGGVRTAVGLHTRSAPSVRYLRDLIAQGYVGEVLSTTAIGSGLALGAATYDPASAWSLEPANGTTMLSVSFAHALDALTMVLGDVTDLSATTAIRRPEVVNSVTGERSENANPDQLALTARLDTGAFANLHFRGGMSRATNFYWEINGTEGDLVVKAPYMLEMGSVTLHGARGSDTELAELPVPSSYERVFAGRSNELAYSVAHAYEQLLTDITTGTKEIPDFEHAVRLHKVLDDIATSAKLGALQ